MGRRVVPIDVRRLAALCAAGLVACASSAAQEGSGPREQHTQADPDVAESPAQRGDEQTTDRVTPEDLQRFRDAVRDLDSPDWPTRHSAAETLRRSPVDNDAFRDLIFSERLDRNTPLSVEQKHQLINILSERILTADAGAIGIQMDRFFRNGVIVDNVFADMPAGRVLEAGDRITHLDGEIVWDSNSFSERMKEYGPGDTIRLRVERPPAEEGPDIGPEIFEVDITLAPAEKLGALHMERLARDRRNEVQSLRDNAPIDSIDLEVASPYGRIDEHPAIVMLKRRLEILDRTDAQQRRAFLRIWQEKYRELQQWAVEPNLSVAERNYRREVFQRYVDLLPNELINDL